MTSLADPDARRDTGLTGTGGGGTPLRFIMLVALTAVAVAATMLAILLLIPDESDYALASQLKHNRLAALPSPKIVLIGGSNLAYGLDGAILEADTGCPVVNMGMNGYLGLRFMLAETLPYLNPPDIVVVSLEYQNFYNPPDGHATSQLMLVKSNPALIDYLTWEQRWIAVANIPLAAQQKLFRIIRSAATLEDDPTQDMVMEIESLSGFDRYGGLTSHLDREWPFERGDQFELSATPVNMEAMFLLQDFARQMEQRGVRTIYSYSPLERDFYEMHSQAIEALHQRLTLLAPVIVPQPPTTFVYDSDLFFDSIYHLNKDGRGPRSQQLAADIRQIMAGAGGCTGG